MFKKLLLATAIAAAAPANAALVFVGSWQVDQGPSWGTQPLAYTGQEAAALLFGGISGAYQISTVSRSVAQIDNQAWYSVIGAGAWAFAQDYSNKFEGTLYGPVDGYNCCGEVYQFTNSASAYVADNASGDSYTNYAFAESSGAVPEPASWALLIVGFGLTGAAMRRRATAVAA